METITIQQITYEIDANVYGGDMLLLSSKQDVRIVGGYDALREMAIEKLGEEYADYEVRYQMDLMLKTFVLNNFQHGDVTVHDQESEATEEALAIISKTRLEKLLSLILDYSISKKIDPDLVWFSDRIEGAIKVKADPARLPY